MKYSLIELEQRVEELETQLKQALSTISSLQQHIATEHSSFELSSQQTQDELNVTQMFLAKIIELLLDKKHIQPSEFKELLDAFEHHYPYPTPNNDNQVNVRANTALRYFFKSLFSQLPKYETTQFREYYKSISHCKTKK